MILAASLVLFQAANPVHPELAELTPRWERAMEACGVPALALVLIEGDEVVHRVTLGRRDPARAEPVTPETIFYIASTTKPYVAFALAQLAEQGKLELDAPVRRYLPRLRLADEELSATLTVRDLLCHRFGLHSGPIVLLDAYTGEIDEERYYHFLSTVESPGRVAYSNLHFTLAGRVIEAVSGLGWRDHLAAHVFAPAGMRRTTGYADWMYAQDDVAIPAVWLDGRAQAAAVRKSDRTMHAAGGLGTSIDDLARWLRLQLGRGSLDGVRLLSERATEASWQLLSESKADADFGSTDGFALGWQRGRYRGHLELRHSGGYVGTASYACFLPELGLGLGVLATGGDGAGALARLVSNDVHERLLADDELRDPLPALLERARAERTRDETRRATAAAAPSALALTLPLARYAGTYRNEWYGTLTLEPSGAGLRGRLGELRFELATPAPDRVLLSAHGPIDGAEGEFELADGTVAALSLELSESTRFER